MVMVDQTQIEKLVIDGLRTVYDPEIPVNIYELGLIYGVAVEPSGLVTIRMTLTAAGCPAAPSLPRSCRVPQLTRAGISLSGCSAPGWAPEVRRASLGPHKGVGDHAFTRG